MGRKGKDEVFGGGLPGRGVAIMKRKVDKKLKEKGFKKDMSAGPAGKLSPAENELDSYNKFVEGVADKIAALPASALKRPPKAFTKAVLSQPPAQRFKRPTKKPVLKTGTKEKVKGLEQNMADGGQVFDMTTEMVIDE